MTNALNSQSFDESLGLDPLTQGEDESSQGIDLSTQGTDPLTQGGEEILREKELVKMADAVAKKRLEISQGLYPSTKEDESSLGFDQITQGTDPATQGVNGLSNEEDQNLIKTADALTRELLENRQRLDSLNQEDEESSQGLDRLTQGLDPSSQGIEQFYNDETNPSLSRDDTSAQGNTLVRDERLLGSYQFSGRTGVDLLTAESLVQRLSFKNIQSNDQKTSKSIDEIRESIQKIPELLLSTVFPQDQGEIFPTFSSRVKPQVEITPTKPTTTTQLPPTRPTITTQLPYVSSTPYFKEISTVQPSILPPAQVRLEAGQGDSISQGRGNQGVIFFPWTAPQFVEYPVQPLAGRLDTPIQELVF